MLHFSVSVTVSSVKILRSSLNMYSVPHRHTQVETDEESRSQGLTGIAITVCLGTAFLNCMANFTVISVSQQVVSNHNVHPNVFTQSRGFISWPLDPFNHLQAI